VKESLWRVVFKAFVQLLRPVDIASSRDSSASELVRRAALSPACDCAHHDLCTSTRRASTCTARATDVTTTFAKKKREVFKGKKKKKKKKKKNCFSTYIASSI
jgi:hypothetical protein